MTRATEIVQALIERAPLRPPLERTTRMPYGWALWLRALPPLPSRPHAQPAEVVGLLIERPPAPIPPGPELATWPAFVSLFDQGWSPPPRDERALRWGSRLGSGVLHVLFVLFLGWMAYLQSVMPPPPEQGGGGERVEVGFVGAGDPGTPQDQAGDGPPGPPPGEAATADAPAPAQASPQAAESDPAQATEQAVAPPQVILPQVDTSPPMPQMTAPTLPQVAQRQVPEPQVAAPVEPLQEQPVQVTEVERPTIDYVLPPTTPPRIEVRPPQVREREVTVVQAPAVPLPQARPVDVPVRQPRPAQVRERAVDEPLPQAQVRPVAVQAPRVEARLPDAPVSSVRQRDVAMPSEPAPSSAPASTPTPAASPSPSPSAAATPSTGTAPAVSPGREAAAAAGPAPGGSRMPSGGATAPSASGGWQNPLPGDDWGQARSGQARPGGAPGLYDDQGRVRLPGEGTGAGQGPGQGPGRAGEGVADRGAPGGESDTWTRDRIEQSGTWLKRPPYDYEPTSFDRYWVPNESLLADWVRKGIKSVAIPIPGTGKKINCVVSLLQLGGGCGITDPDLNEQPATARPPPDVPFKPQLQEDNGSVPPQP